MSMESQRIRDERSYQLYELMHNTSEEMYCAGWHTEVERVMYACAFRGKRGPWGNGELTDQLALQLRVLAEASDAWWNWPDEDVGSEDVEEGPHRIALARAHLLYGSGDPT